MFFQVLAYPIVKFFISGFLVGGLSAIAYLHSYMTAVEIVNVFILGVTAVIVWWYTKAAQQSNEIQERPLLDMYIVSEVQGANTSHFFRIKNIGKSTAYNIRIETLHTWEGYVYGPHLADDNNARIEVGSEQNLVFWVETPTGALEIYDATLGYRRFIQRLFQRDTQGSTDEQRKMSGIFVLNYDGVNGSAYHSIFRIYPILQVSLDSDAILQFVGAGKGFCSIEKAQRLCSDKPLRLHTLERTQRERVRR